MQRKYGKNSELDYNLKELEKEAAVVCRDFMTFCDYIVTNKVKLAKKTGNIGKKDCFALNALLHVKEKYENPTYFQSQYPIINFFYYIAVKYKILERNSAGTGLQEGRNYQHFSGLSVWEQYLLFLSVFLCDGIYAERENSWYSNGAADMWEIYVDSFMEWVDEKKPEVGCKCRLSRASGILYLSHMYLIMPYLEELSLIRVWEQPGSEDRDREAYWEIEALPLLEMVSDLYENTEIEEADIEEDAEIEEGADIEEDADMDGLDAADPDTMIRCVYEAYTKKLLKEQPQGLKLFESPNAQKQEQIIDLEISVRYTDCVRVIRMNLKDSLYDLHRMIQRAVEFDDDHLFEFYIGSGMLKRTYTLSEAMNTGKELSVEGTSLRALELCKGQKFTYLFDFGDMWWFDIKVLEIREGTVVAPQVIKAVNEAPQQYPDYEEMDYGEEDEEESDECKAEISDQVQISDILASIEDELIREEYAALMGVKNGLPKETPAVMRRDMERLLLQNPDRMLAFMTAEMRQLLSGLLRQEWIDRSEKCTLAKLYSFGFCQFPEEVEDVILVPETVKEIYLSKSKAANKNDKITETAEAFLGRCGVMEMQLLYPAVAGFLKSKITYEDFDYLIFSRLHYFGAYYCDCIDGTEYISCYDRDMTQKILAERKKPENAVFDYPDFEKICSSPNKEIPKALENWNEYVKWNMNIDWQTAESLLMQIPAMAASGIIPKEEIVAAYKEILRGTGSRVTKKAENLIGELCLGMPLATKKGNTGLEGHGSEAPGSDDHGLGEAAKPEKKGASNKAAKRGKTQGGKGEKIIQEEYTQLSIFDM